MAEKIGMISLGCPKNQVDAELMLARLSQGGFEITNEVALLKRQNRKRSRIYWIWRSSKKKVLSARSS